MGEKGIELTLEEFSDVASMVLREKVPLLARGPHGIGKSQYMKQVADELGIPMVERRVSQMTEGDLLGLPDRTDVTDFLREAMNTIAETDQEAVETDNAVLSRNDLKRMVKKVEEGEGIANLLNEQKVTKFCPPEWYARCCNEEVLLFLDEIDRGETLGVRQGLFELAGNRKLFGKELHPDTKIVAAGNSGNYSKHYSSYELGHAELDRWAVYDIEVDEDVWLDWAQDAETINDLVFEFIADKREHLMNEGEWVEGKAYPTPRSWERFSCVLNTHKKEMGVDPHDIPQQKFYSLACGFVGGEAAADLRKYRENHEKELQVEELLSGDFGDLSEDWTVKEFSAMIKKLKNEGVLQEREITDEEGEALARFAYQAPSAVMMQLLQEVCTNEDDPDMALENVFTFIDSETPEGQEIRDYYEEMAGSIDVEELSGDDGDDG